MITRETLIEHILIMKRVDEDYARWALIQYRDLLPDFELTEGVREALKGQQ